MYSFDIPCRGGSNYDSVCSQIFGKGVKFNIRISGDVPQTVMGDPTKLKQVIGNLANNAVKFTDAGEILISSLHQQTSSEA